MCDHRCRVGVPHALDFLVEPVPNPTLEGRDYHTIETTSHSTAPAINYLNIGPFGISHGPQHPESCATTNLCCVDTRVGKDTKIICDCTTQSHTSPSTSVIERALAKCLDHNSSKFLKQESQETLSVVADLIHQVLNAGDPSSSPSITGEPTTRYASQSEAEARLFSALARLVRRPSSRQLPSTVTDTELLTRLLQSLATEERLHSAPHNARVWTPLNEIWQKHDCHHHRCHHDHSHHHNHDHSGHLPCTPHLAHGPPQVATHSSLDDHHSTPLVSYSSYVRGALPTPPPLHAWSHSGSSPPTFVYGPNSLITADGLNARGWPMPAPPLARRGKRIRDVSHIRGLWC